MSDYEIVLTVLTALSILLTFVISLISILHINKKKELYLIKKEAILETLKFLDDFLSIKTFYNYPANRQAITRINAENIQDLTFTGRTCFNKLIITCKNADIIDTFCKIIFPQYYYRDKTIKLSDYHNFRMLCRKELGLKNEPTYNKEDITFLAEIE